MSGKAMARQIGALFVILVGLTGCSVETESPASTPPSVLTTQEPNSSSPSATSITLTPTTLGTPESSPATATPTPAAQTGSPTSMPTQEAATATSAPALSLTIIVAPVPAEVAEYSRSHWRHWTDEDGDCQDARQEVLISESLVEVSFESERECRVATGRWYGAFSGAYVDEPGDLDIDHLVPLKNAHDSGGWAWSPDKKREYANYLGDPDHLIAVTSGANRSKGAKGPEEWRPPDEGYWCRYATDWTEVKMEWGLTMTQRETEAIIEMLDTCEEPIEVEAKRAEGAVGTDTSGQTTAGEATAAPILVPEPQENISVYESCEAAVDAGESRVQGSAGGGRGFPREMVPSARDGDGDGIVCER